MKKAFKILFLLFTIILSLLNTSCYNSENSNDSKQLKKITVISVKNMIHFAAFNIAKNQNFFAEEGLDVEFIEVDTGSVIVQELFGGTADIGFAGPEAPILSYTQDTENYPVLFAELNKNNALVLATRKFDENFTFDKLIGKTILGGFPGTPVQVSLEYVLKNNNIDIEKDVDLVTNGSIGNLNTAFISGQGDYAVMNIGKYIEAEDKDVAEMQFALKDYTDEYLYIGFYATNKYIDNNPEIIQSFTNALYKGQLYIENNSSEEIAKQLSKDYPGISLKNLIRAIQFCKDIDTYSTTPIISEEHYDKIIEMMKSSPKNTLVSTPPFKDIVNNTFAKKSVETIK